MPYPPTKTETYVCTGGINQKVSEYITPDTEFLSLENVDFRLMGALSSFAGNTLFSLVGTTSPITGIATFFSTMGNTAQVIAMDEYGVYNATGGSFFALMRSLAIPPLQFEQRSLVLAGTSTGLGALFGAAQRDFWTYQGASTSMWQFSLGKPCGTTSSTAFGVSGSGTLNGTAVLYFSLVRQDGLYGPARAVTLSPAFASALSLAMPSQPNTLIGNTGAPVSIASNVSYGSFGLSGIQVWAQVNLGTIYQYGGLIGLTSGPLYFTLSQGFTTTGASFFAPGASGRSYVEPLDYQGAFIYGLGVTQGGISNFDPTNPDARSMGVAGRQPQCIEYYANRLFSAIGSRVVFSDPGTPEQASYENFFFVAPNEPMQITSMRSYFTQLLIWKFGSTWALSGSSNDSFALTQSTSVYGCISKTANCVWEQKCWFLDSKGICEFNGANSQIVSNRVEDIFKRMNVEAASKTAAMTYVKERNEVWTAIPIDGATMNNTLVVYDHLSNAWTTRHLAGENLSFLTSLTLGQTKPKPYSGTFSGLISTWSSDLIGDNGQAATCVIKSRFINDLGNSVEKMFRRLYVDMTVPQGSTYTFLVNLYADKQTAPYYSTTMSLGYNAVGECTNRIDFGVPAKSLAVEFIFAQNNFLQLNGFTIESRFQRNC